MVTRVLVVDDSAFMRRLLSEMIQEFPDFEVAGTARNGADALQQVTLLRPDVITMDVEMPIMDGLQALGEIMRVRPTPVVMLSSLTQEGADATIQALMLGAVDFIAKPSGSISVDLVHKQNEIQAKLKAAVASRTYIRRLESEAPQVPRTMPVELKLPPIPSREPVKNVKGICAIGTSTGGPKALDAVICSLPADLSVPVVVVQHMPPKFTASLAQRLDQHSELHVVEARHHQTLEPGFVYIAPGGKHMEVEGTAAGFYRIVIHEQDTVNGHRPSVDVLFDSVTRLKGLKKSYVIMTGMGGDGAHGMQRAKQADPQVVTLGESESTCVVYGMPRVAAELKCVDHVLPLTQISRKISEVFSSISRIPRRLQ
ncbi:chemotaxis response regulator protein-glutamate methylesterase [Paenibacillus sp. sgz500958]|uniref:protein-glutamate methylesterase/protein-glutamine glutaminase n=1 Tax=Paenibacillus sp. sgz500958 TaxID=3242475 RepID=UPI0036D241B8